MQNFSCKNEVYLHDNKNDVHINSATSFPGRGENLGTRLINSVTLSLALKQRLGTNRNWPVFE